MVKPAHPCDEVCVKLDASSLEQIVLFIRDCGADVDSLVGRRQYGGPTPGVWRIGSAGLIRKSEGGIEEAVGEADEVGAKKQLIRRCQN